MVVAATTITLMGAGAAGIAAGGVYVFLYTVVVVFSVARNALAVPYGWFVRPRLVVYIWIAVDGFVLSDTLDVVLWSFSAVLGLKLVTGFVAIRRAIGENSTVRARR